MKSASGRCGIARVPTTASGFTLLELLVSIAIFAMLAAVMYGGTQSVIQQREIIEARLSELEQLHRTVRLLNEDFSQMVPRTIRDELGRGDRPALVVEPRAADGFELTRRGWRNPANNPRSSLQRVRYRFDAEERVLYRDYWFVLDRVLGQPARDTVLLENVENFTIEFLDSGNQWQEVWPPAGAVRPTVLPKAVRYQFELPGFGQISRLVEVPG